MVSDAQGGGVVCLREQHGELAGQRLSMSHEIAVTEATDAKAARRVDDRTIMY